MGSKIGSDPAMKSNLCKAFSGQSIRYTTVKRATQMIDDHTVAIFACCQPLSFQDVMGKDRDSQGLYDRSVLSSQLS